MDKNKKENFEKLINELVSEKKKNGFISKMYDKFHKYYSHNFTLIAINFMKSKDILILLNKVSGFWVINEFKINANEIINEISYLHEMNRGGLIKEDDFYLTKYKMIIPDLRIGMPRTKIAEKYNLSASTVYKVREAFKKKYPEVIILPTPVISKTNNSAPAMEMISLLREILAEVKEFNK
jgi:hypothetical protein